MPSDYIARPAISRRRSSIAPEGSPGTSAMTLPQPVRKVPAETVYGWPDSRVTVRASGGDRGCGASAAQGLPSKAARWRRGRSFRCRATGAGGRQRSCFCCSPMWGRGLLSGICRRRGPRSIAQGRRNAWADRCLHRPHCRHPGLHRRLRRGGGTAGCGVARAGGVPGIGPSLTTRFEVCCLSMRWRAIIPRMALHVGCLCRIRGQTIIFLMPPGAGSAPST